MLSVSPSDIHYLPGLECHQALHQTLPADRLTVERIIGSKATLQIIGSSGAMFALNSSLLLLYKNLQKDGRLSRVPVERVSLDKIPASLLSSLTTGATGATRTNHNRTRLAETPGLHSISACVTAKEEFLDTKGPDSEESDIYYDDDSDCEQESDLEDLECVVCKLVFSGESRFDHHRRVSQHWGCGYCHLVFHSSNLLQQHKEAAAHWTDDDFVEQTDSEEDEETVNWDELERLL